MQSRGEGASAAAHRSPVRRDLRAIALDGGFFSLMVGFGESYFAAFALAVGASQAVAGWLATVPILFGALMQLVAPYGVRRLGSHRRWVVLCASLQAMSFLPLVLGAGAGGVPVIAVFAIAGFYWGSGMSTGPAWNTWVGTLVPSRLRARFFARRTRWTHVASFSGLLLGGLVLQAGSAHGNPMLAFAVIFAVAGSSRAVSAVCLASQSELHTQPARSRRVGWMDFLRRLRSGDDGRLLAYMLSVQVTVQIAGPFFTPYMIEQLELDYAGYMFLIAVAMIGKWLALPLLERIGRRRGVLFLLRLGGIGLVPNAALWLVSDNLGYLALAQLFSGFVWASHELAILLLLFEAVDEHERTSLLTSYNLGHASAVLGGSLIGGLLLQLLGEVRVAYLVVFALSSVARAATLPLLARVRPRAVAAHSLTTRTLAVRPAAGTIERPVLSGLTSETGETR